MIIKSKTHYSTSVDWWSVVIYMLLVLIGFLSIHSASYNIDLPFDMKQKSVVQLIWVSLSFIIGGTILFMKKELFYKLSIPLYLVTLIIHFLLIFIGKEVNGAKSWIEIGSFAVQPVEFGKVAAVLMLARILSDHELRNRRLNYMFYAIAIILTPMILIVLQNDTGSALVFAGLSIVLFIEGLNYWFYVIAISMIVLFVFSLLFKPIVVIWILLASLALHQSYINKTYLTTIKYLSLILLSTLLIYGASWWWEWGITIEESTLASVIATLVFIGYWAVANKTKNLFKYIGFFTISLTYCAMVEFIFNNILKIHQQKRILDLLGLELDLKGWGYNVNQSMIAIGSGGFWGKGYMKGTQTKYSFVPEQSTDFIFCTIGEEGGFIMTSLTILLFSLFIFRLLKIASKINDNFAKIYTFGAVSILTVHLFVNIGMTIGLVPVIGIPLPFISYGGSSLLAFTSMVFIAIRLCAESKRDISY